MLGLIAGYASEGSEASVTMFDVVVYILMMIGFWKLFEKMDMPGWYGIIPVFNVYKLFEKVAGSGWYVLSFIIPFIGTMVLGYNTAKAFSKSTLFMLGLMLLPGLFYPILGFGSSEYFGVKGCYDTRTPEERAVKTIEYEIIDRDDDDTVNFDVK